MHVLPARPLEHYCYVISITIYFPLIGNLHKLLVDNKKLQGQGTLLDKAKVNGLSLTFHYGCLQQTEFCLINSS